VSAAVRARIDSGDFVESPFPSAPARSARIATRGLLTIGRPLSSTVTAQLVAGGEYSTLVQEGAGGKERSFFRPKGSLNLAAS
jgi:outer membrane receptor for ferrienterochelin and colicins